MGNPYAPPTSTEQGADSEESSLPTRHWFWKAYALAFAAVLLVDTVAFVLGRMPLQGVVHHGTRVLAGVGVLAYAFSRWIGPRWVWRQMWWFFPLSELIVYLTERAAVTRVLAALPVRHAMTTFQIAQLFVPLASLALYRFGRTRILT